MENEEEMCSRACEINHLSLLQVNHREIPSHIDAFPLGRVIEARYCGAIFLLEQIV